MNNKGFTLAELLAVIVILAIIISIGTTGAVSVSNRSKRKMYDSKIKMILSAANLYAQDEQLRIDNNGSTVTVQVLLDKGYLKKDDDDRNIINPIDGKNLNNCSVEINKVNNRYTSKTLDDDNCTWIK